MTTTTTTTTTAMKKTIELAVISGSGMDDLFRPARMKRIRTRYGPAAVSVVISHHQRAFYHLQRHGPGHLVPPHAINFRANIAALGKLGATEILTIHAVGSMSESFRPGELGLIEQFIDFGRSGISFFDKRPVHTDMTSPYDHCLQEEFLAAGRRVSVRLHRGLVYASVTGPRYETAAEIRMMKMLGAHVVGMTGAPEAILANELGLRIASIAVATNWAAGIQERVNHEEVLAMMRARAGDVGRLLEALVSSRG